MVGIKVLDLYIARDGLLLFGEDALFKLFYKSLFYI